MFTRVLIRLMVAGAVLIGGTFGLGRSAPAAVPGSPFTETACEGDSDSVARLYTAGLGRSPERAGFDFWLNEYVAGRWSFPQMAQFFVDSPEFAAGAGTPDREEFVRRLYRNVLGRDGESTGVAYWTAQMSAGMSRATVLMRFAESPENIDRTGTRLPTLGPFNEGRSGGGFRCGPELAWALLGAEDFTPGWSEQLQPVRPPASAGCRSALRLPDEIETTLFVRDGEFGAVVGHSLYSYPTRSGAGAYMAQVRDAVIDCSSFVDRDWLISIRKLGFATYGDETLAVRISQLSPNGRWNWVVDFVVVRVGTTISVVDHTDLFTVDSGATEAYVAVATDRLRALLDE